MKTIEFGEVVVLFEWEEIPVGMVLREAMGGTVVLVEHYGNADEDVLHVFESCNLAKKSDFAECICIARQYTENADIPIYVFSEKITNIPQDVVQRVPGEEKKYTCMECTVEWKQRHPWSASVPKEKCAKCPKRKKSE